MAAIRLADAGRQGRAAKALGWDHALFTRFALISGENTLRDRIRLVGAGVVPLARVQGEPDRPAVSSSFRSTDASSDRC